MQSSMRERGLGGGGGGRMGRLATTPLLRALPQHLCALLHIDVALNYRGFFLRLRHHVAHRPHEHAVPVGDVTGRRVARAAHGGDPELGVEGSRAHEEVPVQGAGGHVEGAGVQEERAAPRRVAAVRVTHCAMVVGRLSRGREGTQSTHSSASRGKRRSKQMPTPT
jgi:hypothetical protein